MNISLIVSENKTFIMMDVLREQMRTLKLTFMLNILLQLMYVEVDQTNV